MFKTIDKKLRLVRIRCSINLLLRHLGRVLAVAGIIAILAILTERLLAMTVIEPWSLWSFWTATLVLVLLLWMLKQPSRMQVSLLVDRRLKLRERLSTTLALAASEDPFAEAARQDALDVARRIKPQAHFPVRPSRCWLYATGAWALAILCMFVPQKDLFGARSKRDRQDKNARQVQVAEAEVKKAADPVKMAVKQLDNPELQEALGDLEQTQKGAKPDQLKRDAIRKLGGLSDRLKNMQNGTTLESVNLMQQMLKQLKGSTNPVSQQLRLAMAQGNFADAANILRQLQKQLAEGKLSSPQRQELSRELQNLAKQLQALAEKNQELEKELEKLGLDKKLANMDANQLKQALKKQGLANDKIQELLRKAAACRMACSRCSGMGQAMAACGAGAGLSGDELNSIMEQLDDLEALKQQLALTEASIEEIGRAMACLGAGMCQGMGYQGPWMEGYSRGAGGGTGGPGIGYGPRNTAENGQTANQKTRVQSKGGKGPVIASWYFKDSQVVGEARRDFSEVIQAARDIAAEAVSENEIPRKYEDAVKQYFTQLEESKGK